MALKSFYLGFKCCNLLIGVRLHLGFGLSGFSKFGLQVVSLLDEVCNLLVLLIEVLGDLLLLL